MAQNTAAFEGLQYSSQAGPVDFGSIAQQFSAVAQQKKLEEEAKKKEIEKTKIDTYREFGDIFDPFEATSIEDLDVVGGLVQSNTISAAEELTKKFSSGELSRDQYYLKMKGLKSDSTKMANYLKSGGEYASKVSEMQQNGTISQATLKQSEALMSQIKKGINIGRDRNNRMTMTYVDNGKNVTSTFNSLGDALEVREKTDLNSVIKNIASASKASETYDKKKGVTRVSILKNGNLSNGQSSLISDEIKSFDDKDAYDAAIQLGLEPGYVYKDGRFAIEDREKLNGLMIEKMNEKAVDYMSNLDVENEVEGFKLGLLQQEANRKSAETSSTKTPKTKFTVTRVGGDVFYTPNQDIQTKKIPSKTLNGQNYNNFTIVGYKEKANGTGEVEISYDASADAAPGILITDIVKKSTVVKISNPADIAYIRGSLEIQGDELPTQPGPQTNAVIGTDKYNKKS